MAAFALSPVELPPDDPGPDEDESPADPDDVLADPEPEPPSLEDESLVVPDSPEEPEASEPVDDEALVEVLELPERLSFL